MRSLVEAKDKRVICLVATWTFTPICLSANSFVAGYRHCCCLFRVPTTRLSLAYPGLIACMRTVIAPFNDSDPRSTATLPRRVQSELQSQNQTFRDKKMEAHAPQAECVLSNKKKLVILERGVI